MFRLSQKADYGLILLSNLSKSKKPVSVAQIAKKNEISTKFLSQIAGELKRAGILKSREGVSGGYSLAKKPNEIKLLDVLKTLGGELVIGECFEEDHQCHCGGKDIWIQMKKQMEAAIDSKTVADLAV